MRGEGLIVMAKRCRGREEARKGGQGLDRGRSGLGRVCFGS